MNRRYRQLMIEGHARKAGPWTDADAVRADQLRRKQGLTEDERIELAILRLRETNECVRLRREMAR